jgi:tetratricopeptide (TPR) repeat protein
MTDRLRSSGSSATTGYTRNNSGGYTRDSSSRASRSTVGTTSGGSRGVSLSDAIVDISPRAGSTRRSSGSSIPKLYSSSEQRGLAARAGTPSGSRRLALSERLREATAPKSRTGSPTPSSLADRYTPSARERVKPTSAKPGRAVSKPGATRRSALAPTKESRRTRATSKVAGSDQKATDPAALRKRYNAAKLKDRKNARRAELAAAAAATALDKATRAGLATVPFTRGASGYGYGTKPGYVYDPWAGYYPGGTFPGGSCYNWYWNSCYPTWCSWWLGSCASWWYPCYGWGWGLSFSWGWGWGSSCYYPSYSSCWWPTYAYCSPSVIYQYVEVPVYAQVPAEEAPAAAAGPGVIPTPVADSSLGHRAASEYMALGDRAFIEARYGDAVHYYAKAIEFSPEDGVLYLVLSDALFATGDYHYAAYAVRSALEKNPELAELALDKRDFYGDPTDFDRQLALLEDYHRDHFLDEDARLVLAANYLFSKQAERCMELLDSPLSEETKASPAGQLLSAAAAASLAK